LLKARSTTAAMAGERRGLMLVSGGGFAFWIC
jgi:hypothetical protein